MKMDEEEFNKQTQRSRTKYMKAACSVLHDPFEAEDAVQEGLIKAWNYLPGFRGESKDGSAKCSFDTWMVEIVRREAGMLLRKKQVRAAFNKTISELTDKEQDLIAGNLAIVEPTQFNNIQNDERSRIISEAIEKLPACSRVAVKLHYCEEIPIRDIVDILASNENTVKVQLFRGRERLNRLLAFKVLNIR